MCDEASLMLLNFMEFGLVGYLFLQDRHYSYWYQFLIFKSG